MNINLIEDQVLKLFYQDNSLEYIPYIKEIVPNIDERKQELLPNQHINNKAELNGSMVLPIPPNGNYYILINSKLLTNDYYDPFEYYESLIHEITHLHDYVTFANNYCNGNYQQITSHDKWLYLYMFSEYHAKKMGMKYYYKILIENTEKNCLETIEQDTIQYYTNSISSFTKRLSKLHNSNVVEFIYNTFRLLGLLTVWEEMFNNKFSLQKYTTDFQKLKVVQLLHLYKFLYDKESYHQADKNGFLMLVNKTLETIGVNIK